MKPIVVTAQPISPAAFQPYGEVIQRPDIKATRDFESYAYWDKIIKLDLSDSPPELGFLVVRHRPFTFTRMERHRKATQTFIPYSSAAGIIVVAAGDPEADDDVPDPSTVRAFYLDGQVGYHLFRGTWHLSPFPIAAEAEFVMVVRRDTIVDDQEIVELGDTVQISLG